MEQKLCYLLCHTFGFLNINFTVLETVNIAKTYCILWNTTATPAGARLHLLLSVKLERPPNFTFSGIFGEYLLPPPLLI